MKRYRVLSTDFDTRTSCLLLEIKEDWQEEVKKIHHENKKQIIRGLVLDFGEHQSDEKIQNFKDIGDKPLSVLAFHNKFFEQVRIAFIMGAYYPALTGACALGERILNHLILELRDSYKQTTEYKKVSRKNQFDNWKLLIKVLSSWDVLLPEVVTKFGELRKIRNRTIHFQPETYSKDRALALSAISILRDIISNQFSGFGTQPWFFCVPGEIYIKEEWRNRPFIQKVYVPNSFLVGPYHVVESVTPKWLIRDDYKYEHRKITDQEFIEEREVFNKNGQKQPG